MSKKMAKLFVIGLIVTLAWCLASILTEGSPDGSTPEVEIWLYHYKALFTDTGGGIPPLSSDGIIERLQILHGTRDQVRENKLIEGHMIHFVGQWYDAIMGKDASHCNRDYFCSFDRALASTIDMRHPPAHMNQLFQLFYDNVGAYCRQALADSLRDSLGEPTLNVLRDIRLAHESFVEGKISSKELAERAFGHFGLQKSSTAKEIIKTWKRGPCLELQQVTHSPDKRAIYALIQTDNLRATAASNQAQETIDFWYKMESACEQLDSMVASLAADYTSGITSKLSRWMPTGPAGEVKTWLKRYEQLFVESDPKIPPLSFDEIIERLEFLHSTQNRVRYTQWVEKHMIDAVTMWYDAIMNQNAAKCNLEHFERMRFPLQVMISYILNPPVNSDRMFELYHRNLRNFCRQLLFDHLNSSLSDQTKNDLRSIEHAHESWSKGEIPRKELAMIVFGPTQSQKSRQEVADSWESGPCGQLQGAMWASGKQAIYDLIQTERLQEQSENDHVDEFIQMCFRMRRVCGELLWSVDDMASDYTSV